MSFQNLWSCSSEKEMTHFTDVNISFSHQSAGHWVSAADYREAFQHKRQKDKLTGVTKGSTHTMSDGGEWYLYTPATWFIEKGPQFPSDRGPMQFKITWQFLQGFIM